MRAWCVAIVAIVAIVAVLGVAACGGDSGGSDVTGPFTGTTHRFVVDRLEVPLDETMAKAIADDLDGNGERENHFGTITGLLASINDLSRDSDSMIASGALASTIELVADDLMNDDAVGATFFGADQSPATVAGGVLAGGVFTSNRTATTRVPGRAELRVPAFTNADPLALTLEGTELDLTPDGAGGYDAVIRGGLPQQSAREAAYAGLWQMFLTEPARHREFLRGVDTDRDGMMSAAELDGSVIAFLVTADVRVVEMDTVSLAIAFHLAPCAEGRCTSAAPANPCRDRVRDGDETDVDCGGACQPCAGMKACAQPADCQSGICSGSTCAAPSCTDGVHDGFESDLDCGGACPACALGQMCIDDPDCASATCTDGVCVAAP